MKAEAKEIMNHILNAIYPVGSIYISTLSTSPAELIGGTWQAINGRFLVAQGSNEKSGNEALNLSAGATGGETNHTLSVNEIPSHNHGGKTGGPSNNTSGSAAPALSGYGSTRYSLNPGSGGYRILYSSGADGSTLGAVSHTHSLQSHTHTISAQGGGVLTTIFHHILQSICGRESHNFRKEVCVG